MKLLFKQRLFSWFDSYDIYDEIGATLYTVEGKLAWGHRLHVLDASGTHIATLKEKVLTLLPRFELYVGDRFVGEIVKEFTLFKPRFSLSFMGWNVTGDWLQWDYQITDSSGQTAARVQKLIWNFTDTYEIEVYAPQNALYALMVVLAIDAVKCRENG